MTKAEVCWRAVAADRKCTEMVSQNRAAALAKTLVQLRRGHDTYPADENGAKQSASRLGLVRLATETEIPRARTLRQSARNRAAKIQHAVLVQQRCTEVTYPFEERRAAVCSLRQAAQRIKLDL